MASPFPTTRFSGGSRAQSLAVLALAAALLAWFLLACVHRPAASVSTIAAQGGEDLQLYRAIVARTHDGESYYDAAGDELRRRGYPSGSVFNWRPPTYAWLMSALPDPIYAQRLLIGIALLTLGAAYSVERRDGGVAKAALLVVLLVGALLWTIDGEAYFSQELWSGALIVLSISAYGLRHRYFGLAVGLLALFFRELALPYVLVALLLAWRHGRRSEVLLWLAGLALCAGFFCQHSSEILRRLSGGDRVEAEGWVQFGGPRFVLSTVQMNAFLFSLPRAASAIYLVLALLGLIGWRGEQGGRVGLTAAAYLLAFAVVGKPFNNYWGLLDAPLLAFGLVRAPAALRDLVANLQRKAVVGRKSTANF